MMKHLHTLALLFVVMAATAQNSPVAVNDTFTVNKNIATSLPVSSNDFDLDGDPLTVTLVATPANGTATLNGNNVVYLSNLNFTGNDSFLYSICDTTGRCDTASVFVIVLGNNNPPLAQNDTFTFAKNLSVILPILSNDSDPDGDPLTLALLLGPQNGTATINASNQVNYTPDAGYIGLDSFTYIICDNSNACDTAFVLLIITGQNDSPTANDDLFSFIFSENNKGKFLDVVLNDTDPQNAELTITEVFTASMNVFAVEFDSVSQRISLLLPFAYACGADTFTYRICNPFNLCDTATAVIDIPCPEQLLQIEGFSPNGDGINDLLVFKGIENFGPAILKVFNRYGSIVYESEDYRNTWNGEGIDSKKPLPDGAYFYTVQLSNGKKFSNYLMIHR